MITSAQGLPSLSQADTPTLAGDGLPARETGPWVHDKKYYFERYLDIFTNGVGKKWKGQLAYADLFSGPGKSIVRETCEVVNGSPLVALEYNFARYVFVDVPDVIATLRERLKDHPKKDCIRLIEGDCNTVVDDIRAALPTNHLTLAFIDPTGLQIQFKTIKRLVEARKIDLLMTIQFGMGIKMNIHQYIAANKAKLSAFLGNDSWRADAKAVGVVSDLCQRILRRYIGELQNLGFGMVREIPIHNQNNLLLYFMVLASRHPLGEQFWLKITDIKSSGQRRLF